MAKPFGFTKDFLAVDLDDDLLRTLRRMKEDSSRFIVATDRTETGGHEFIVFERGAVATELKRLREQSRMGTGSGGTLSGRATLRDALADRIRVASRAPSVSPFRIPAAGSFSTVSVVVSAGAPKGIVLPAAPAPAKGVTSRKVRLLRRTKLALPKAAAPPLEAAPAAAAHPGPPPPVFPSIKVTDEHPVQGTRIDVSVSLDYDADPSTIGAVEVPDDGEQVLDVHLMLGEESRWGTLVFEHPEGTKEEARFDGVMVPELEPDDYGRVPENRLVEMAVNFYLKGRWCGEGVRRLDVRSKADVSPLPRVAPPKIVPWRAHLCVEPKAPPPDLLVRIQRLEEGRYLWSLLSPHRTFTALGAAECTSDLGTPPYRFAQDHFGDFSSATLDARAETRLTASCDFIYRAAPQGFRKAYWDLYLESQVPDSPVRLETIQFVSDEPYVPWELMRVSDLARAAHVPPEILGVRHAVGRWTASSSCELRHALDVGELAVFATDYANAPRISAKLPWAAAERDHLRNAFQATPHPVRYDDLVGFLRTGSAQAIHFSCHGRSNPQTVDRATLQLEDEDINATVVLSEEAHRGVGMQKPFVFLNACQAAVSGQALGLVFGWPEAFLEMGATACVAPLWNVVDQAAKDVAQEFYAEVLKRPGVQPGPRTLGEALRVIRSQWKSRKSLTYLGYVLYGDPTATLAWHPSP